MNIQIYQIAYSPETLARVESGYQVLNNLANPRPDWHAYWPIREFLLNNDLQDDTFYGFLSPRFQEKTRLSATQVHEFVAAAANESDVVTFSPEADMGAFFLNLFEQNELFDPDFMKASQNFFDEIGYPVDLKNLIMNSQQVVTSNYFIARREFWQSWLELNEQIFRICEDTDSPLNRSLTTATSSGNGVQRKVFLSERIASLLLANNPDWRVRACNPFNFTWSTSGLHRYPHEAVLSDALKIAARETGYPQYMSAYTKVRECLGKPASTAPVPEPEPTPELSSEDKLIKHFLEQNQSDPKTLYYLSLIYLNKNNFKAALDCIEKAISLNSNVYYFHSHRGDVLLSANQTEIAIAAYCQALSLNPDNEPVNKKLASIHQVSKGMDATINIYKASGLKRYCVKNKLVCVDVLAEENVDVREALSHGKRINGNVAHRYKTSKSYIAELHNVHIVSHAGYIITEDNNVLDDEFEEQSFDKANFLSNLKHRTLISYKDRSEGSDHAEVMAIVPKNIINIDECILLTARGASNYFHWLIEVIPKLHLLDKHEKYKSIPLIVEANMPEQHYELLKMLAGNTRKIIFADIDTHYVVKHAVIPSRLSRLVFDYQPGYRIEYDDFRFNPIAIKYLREKLIKGTPSSKSRRLYLTRKGSKLRSLVNEQEIENLFKQYGFEVVYPAKLNIDAQLKLFSSAEIIAGPSGAAFSNIIFAPKNCKVMLFTQHGENTHVIYHALANATGLHEFYKIEGEIIKDAEDNLNEYKQGRAMHADFEVELTSLEKILQAIV